MKSSAILILATTLMGFGALANAHGGPCKGVHKACKHAGKSGKDIQNCAKTIKNGGTVEGVTVSDGDLAMCKAGKKTK